MPAPAAPPPRIESYIQVRSTQPEGGEAFSGVRRLRLNVRGEHFLVQFFAKDGNRSPSDGRVFLQDVWWRQPAGRGTLTLGQVRPPFSRERLTPDLQLVYLDRATVVDALMPGGGFAYSFARDLGALYEARDAHGSLAAGIFGGNGTLQQHGRGNGPLLAARRLWQAGPGTEVGLAAAWRRDRKLDLARALPGTRPLGLGAFSGSDTRLGLEAAWQGAGWRAQGEWLVGRFSGWGAGVPDHRAQGGYVRLTRSLGPRVEATLGGEVFDPDARRATIRERRALFVGVNLRPGPDPRARVQVGWTHARGDVLSVQYQRWFYEGPITDR